jgi:MFS family permease
METATPPGDRTRTAPQPVPAGARLTILVNLLHFSALASSRPYITLLAVEHGAGSLAIGLIAASFSIVQVFLALAMGRLLDRIGSRLPVMAGAVLFTLAVAALMLTGNLYLIAVCSLLMGLSSLTILLGSQHRLTSMPAGPERDHYVGLMAFVNSVGNFAGPAIGGYTISLLGLNHGFLASVAISACSVAVATLAPVVRNDDSMQGSEPISILLGNSRLVRTILVSATLLFCIEVLNIYLPLYGSQVGLSAAAIGIVFSVNGFTQMLIRPFMKTLIGWIQRDRLLFLCLLAGGICVMAFGLAQSFTALVIIAACTGTALGLSAPLTLLAVSYIAPPRQRSQALALRITGNYLGLSISPVVFGLFAGVVGLAPVFWISGAILALNAGMVSKIGIGKG